MIEILCPPLSASKPQGLTLPPSSLQKKDEPNSDSGLHYLSLLSVLSLFSMW